jgi:hypothetical protein
MRPKTHEPRWPNGPVIGLGIASDALCLTFGDGTGAVKTESYGGLHGRLDAAALRDRLRQLQPSSAMLFFRLGADADFEAGVILGTAIGMLSAMGIPVEHPPLPPTVTATDGMALH